jgi:hypothetical protein
LQRIEKLIIILKMRWNKSPTEKICEGLAEWLKCHCLANMKLLSSSPATAKKQKTKTTTTKSSNIPLK